MKAYSEDLRNKIVAAVENGMSKTQAAKTFGGSRSPVKLYATAAGEGKPSLSRNCLQAQARRED